MHSVCTQVSIFVETQPCPGADRGHGEATADADGAQPGPRDPLLLPLRHQVRPPPSAAPNPSGETPFCSVPYSAPLRVRVSFIEVIYVCIQTYA